MKNNPKPSPTTGTISYERGAKPKPHEEITAQALAHAGYNIRFIPSSKVIGRADCYINDTIFEIKSPEGKGIRCIERNLRKAASYQSTNIIVDSFRIKNLDDKSIEHFLLQQLRKRHGIQRLLFVNRHRQTIDINARL